MSDYDEYINKIKENSQKSKNLLREQAIKHVANVSGSSEKDAECFFDGIKKIISEQKNNIIINSSLEDVLYFISHKKLPQNYSHRRIQIENALECRKMSPIIALLSNKEIGDRKLGCCSIILSGLQNRSIIVNGDVGRVRNPSRKDFCENPIDILLSWENADYAMASSSIMSLGIRELSGGISNAISEILDEEKEFGPCNVLIFGGIRLEDISKIIVTDDISRNSIESAIEKIDRLIPIEISTKNPIIYRPFLDSEEKDSVENNIQPKMLYFSLGDRVSFKPSQENFVLFGNIIDMSNGTICVQWDDNNRTIFDMIEALSRLMPAPEEYNTVISQRIYSLPGMDEDTVSLLSYFGIDPVNLYSLISTFLLPNMKSRLEEKEIINALRKIGIDGKFVNGFSIKNEHGIAYSKNRWFEAKLPYGNKLIIEFIAGKTIILAGKTNKYVLLPEFTDVSIE